MRRSAAVLFVSVALVGCSSDVPNTSQSGEERRGPIRVQVSGEPEETRVYRALVTAYLEDNPGEDVELVEIAEKDDHLQKLTTDFASGDPADVFLVNFREYSQFVTRGATEPVGPLLEERGVDLADYYEAPLEAFTYDGALQCMPQNISSLVVYYNKTLFREAGLRRPPEGWGWDEFREVAERLTGNGVHGLGLEGEIIRLAPFAWSNGGEIVDDETAPTRFTLDDPATREALEYLVSLVRESKVVPSEAELAAQDLETRFVTGKLAMLLSSRRDTPVFREVAGLDWDVAPLPVAEEEVGILHSDGYCVASGSNVDSAADFIAYATGEQGQTITALGGRTVPSLISVSESPAFLDPSQPPAHSQVFLDVARNIRRTPVLPTWPEIEDICTEFLTRAFYEEGYTIDQAIADIDEATRPLFEEARQE